MTLALMFPGQGAQSPGFLHRLPQHEAVAATLDEASAALGLDVLTLDSAEALRSTVAVQIGLTVAGVACSRALARFLPRSRAAQSPSMTRCGWSASAPN
jgi:malonate decarboxylase epsilon subunit